MTLHIKVTFWKHFRRKTLVVPWIQFRRGKLESEERTEAEGSAGSLVGLSMMCYRLREANKTCLGERQERGRMGKLL